MSGKIGDQLFFCIVISLILMFLKGGFIAIAIIWAIFFLFMLPKDEKRKKRAAAYAELRKNPNKYEAALLKIKDICDKDIFFATDRANAGHWWFKELDPETREYIRKTHYYDHRLFKDVKSADQHIIDQDKQYLYVVKIHGKKNIDAAIYAKRIINGEVVLSDYKKREWWCDKLTPEERRFIQRLGYCKNPAFDCIMTYDYNNYIKK